RIRAVASEPAVATLEERGLIEDCGRSQFGAILYRTSPLFQRLFGLASLDALPDPSAFDPSPEEEGELRDRLLKAGEVRAGGPAASMPSFGEHRQMLRLWADLPGLERVDRVVALTFDDGPDA